MIYPIPEKVIYGNGALSVKADPILVFDNVFESVCRSVEIFCEKCETADMRVYAVPDKEGRLSPDISLRFDPTLSGEAYRISVSEKGILAFFGTDVAAFRALTSVFVLLRDGTPVPFCEIEDSPSVEDRGFMMDISRDRVPKLETILATVDILAEMKYNQLQLYLEQPAVEFSNFPDLAKDIEALTPAEILKIKAYCKDRFITLVPNLNSFGHSRLWLIKPELRALATIDGGYVFDPTLKETYEFFDKAYDSLLSCFDSEYFNVGCDEVSELDHPESRIKELCEREGTVNVYLAHVKRLNEMITARGKRMMMWADIILHHPETIEALPKDIIPLAWGYSYDSDLGSQAKLLSEKGFDFYVCPGTSVWACITGFYENAVKNIENAVNACVKHGGKGVLITDWGDIGSVAFSFVSLRQILYGGAMMWNCSDNSDPKAASDWADKYFYRCRNGSFSEMIDLLGKGNDMIATCSAYLLNFLWEISDVSMLDEHTPENAVKYSNGTGIFVTVLKDDENFIISVKSKGGLLPEKELPYIFRSFWRGSNAENTEGSGIGLFTASEIIKKLGGNIYAKRLTESDEMEFVIFL